MKVLDVNEEVAAYDVVPSVPEVVIVLHAGGQAAVANAVLVVRVVVTKRTHAAEETAAEAARQGAWPPTPSVDA